MSSFKQPSPAQLDLLLKLAGQQLHIDPQVLRCQLEQGDFSSLQANMDSQSATRLNALLADPAGAFQNRPVRPFAEDEITYILTCHIKRREVPCPKRKTPLIWVQ